MKMKPRFARSARRYWLLLGYTVLVIELAAFTLLKSGYSAAISLGYTVAAGFCFLAWPLFTLLARAVGRTGARVATPLARRQTYRFRLSTLLILVFLFSCVLAFQSYQRRRLDTEYQNLSGKWRVLNEHGQPFVDRQGQPVLVDFNRTECALIEVSSEIRSIDFHTSSGTCEAIYRWEGRRLRLRQSSEGLCRPRSFATGDDPELKPGSGPGVSTCSHWLLERVGVD